ncbi:hypothetical protein E2C01_033125 [Portunus trituberculatus]|uniref:Uncharacterized protein n=1 Tax=Portunus trituberculatus TaxID=210409 RepID=A0A5B7F4T3_PORTR|nr:hypothetical protein [Portunus trituberculatus]
MAANVREKDLDHESPAHKNSHRDSETHSLSSFLRRFHLVLVSSTPSSLLPFISSCTVPGQGGKGRGLRFPDMKRILKNFVTGHKDEG